MELLNATPVVMDRAILWDRTGAEQLILALKGTWDIGPNGALTLAPEQSPVVAVDVFHGEPDSSSIAQEAEMGLPKLTTDIFLVGSVRARNRDTRVMDVQLKAGRLGMTARISGPRFWQRRLGVAKVSEPEPFEAVPLMWENAFGGTDCSPDREKHHTWLAENPVGRGWRAKHSKLEWIDQPLPCIEHPRDQLGTLGQKVRTVGFGPICRHWEPRRRYAGTYDERWTEERMPLLPDDFDDRFHNSAPPGLVARHYLQGGQEVIVTGCTSERVLRLELPRVEALGFALVDDQPLHARMELNSVTVDVDRRQLRLLWKSALNVHRRLNRVQQVECSFRGELP